MRLKQLEIFGFKSFFDKAVLPLRPGITAIVGPNGCGKSNVADAMLWVLGEQRPRTIRGEKMEDILFNGTDLRKPLGMAEVSLTFTDIDNRLSPPYSTYSEITVSRRLFRSGESDYLINKNPCRLKDIRDLLIDSGYRSHSVIEQGKVEALIQASPLQRREFVEEVAGVAKYRARRMEALRKLEATEQNLIRIRDIIGEVQRQRQSLDRQAKRAEKYQGLKDELKSLELQIASVDLCQLDHTLKELTQREGALTQQMTEQENKIAQSELVHAEAVLLFTQKEQELSVLTRTHLDVESKIQRLQGKQETLSAQMQAWHETTIRTDQEIFEIRKSEGEWRVEEEKCLSAAGTLRQTLLDETRLLHLCQRDTDIAEGALTQKLLDQEKAQKILFGCMIQLDQIKQKIASIALRKEDLARRSEQNRLEFTTISTNHDERRGRLTAETERLALIATHLSEKQVHRMALLAEIQSGEDLFRKTSEKITEKKEARAACMAELASRRGFYQNLIGQKEGASPLSTEMVCWVGLVAEIVDVPVAYERGVEAALGSKIRGMVVEGAHALKDGIALLKKKNMGGTVLPKQPRGAFGEHVVKDVQFLGIEGVIGRMADLVTYDRSYGPLVETMLGGILLVSDMDVAWQIWESERYNGTLMTLKGETLDASGIVSTGTTQEVGLLEQKREIKRLAHQLIKAKDELEVLGGELECSERSLDVARQGEVKLTSEIRALEIEHLNRKKDCDHITTELERLSGVSRNLSAEQVREESEMERLCLDEVALQGEVEVLEQRRGMLEADSVTQEGVLGAIQTQAAAIRDQTLHRKMAVTAFQEKERSLLERQRYLKTEGETLAYRLQQKIDLLASLKTKRDSSDLEMAQHGVELGRLAGEHDQLRGRLQQESLLHATLRDQVALRLREAGVLRTQREGLKQTLHENALRVVEVRMTQEKIRETILRDYQMEILPMTDVDISLSIENSREKAKELRQSLDQMGGVNLTAIETYQELSTRHIFLTSQESDLTRSMESLRQTIGKINETTQSLFLETFHMLNQKFQERFVSFFNGGRAELTLTDEADPLEAGVEIIAEPTGKRPKTINQLSGGEKALTVISLLFAAILIHPSPFCLMDEIDAALDEENTRRFTEALVEVPLHTQLFVITHNKRTMDIANTLYGVTMEERGISKIVSVVMEKRGEG